MLMFMSMDGVAAASGSTCSSKALKASHVLTAMGLSAEITQGSLLFTIGLQNSVADADYVLEIMPPIVQRLRQMSPLYAKFIKGKK
jgi:cysteine desulfurase